MLDHPYMLHTRMALTPDRITEVRRTVSARMSRWGCHELVDSAVLGITELLTNVLQHTGSPQCAVLVRRTRGGVRVAVSDTDHTPPVVKELDWESGGGRGMHIVCGLAEDWGVTVTAMGKDVWFELCAPGHDPRGAPLPQGAIGL